jgi:hypothetical protein
MEIKNSDPTKCPHGLSWFSCKDTECFKELCRAEDEATCKHGFLVGCPVCTADIDSTKQGDTSGTR